MEGRKYHAVNFLCAALLLLGSAAQSAELAIDGLVEFDLIGVYQVEAVTPEGFAQEQYQITIDGTSRVYTVSVSNNMSRQGVRGYYSQALDSIPLIHHYELIFTTSLGPAPSGFIFKKPEGYLVEYMKDLKGGLGVFIKTETDGEDYLTAVHEALDILSRFRPGE
ncbi:MAG: hypothetical protein AAB211_03880 [Pseudomonadota bacterium]